MCSRVKAQGLNSQKKRIHQIEISQPFTVLRLAKIIQDELNETSNEAMNFLI